MIILLLTSTMSSGVKNTHAPILREQEIAYFAFSIWSSSLSAALCNVGKRDGDCKIIYIKEEKIERENDPLWQRDRRWATGTIVRRYNTAQLSYHQQVHKHTNTHCDNLHLDNVPVHRAGLNRGDELEQKKTIFQPRVLEVAHLAAFAWGLHLWWKEWNNDNGGSGKWELLCFEDLHKKIKDSLAIDIASCPRMNHKTQIVHATSRHQWYTTCENQPFRWPMPRCGRHQCLWGPASTPNHTTPPTCTYAYYKERNKIFTQEIQKKKDEKRSKSTLLFNSSWITQQKSNFGQEEEKRKHHIFFVETHFRMSCQIMPKMSFLLPSTMSRPPTLIILKRIILHRSTA